MHGCFQNQVHIVLPCAVTSGLKLLGQKGQNVIAVSDVDPGLPAEASKRMLAAHVQRELLPPLGAWLGRALAAGPALAAAAAAAPASEALKADEAELLATVADISAVCRLVAATVVASRGSFQSHCVFAV